MDQPSHHGPSDMQLQPRAQSVPLMRRSRELILPVSWNCETETNQEKVLVPTEEDDVPIDEMDAIWAEIYAGLGLDFDKNKHAVPGPERFEEGSEKSSSTDSEPDTNLTGNFVPGDVIDLTQESALDGGEVTNRRRYLEDLPTEILSIVCENFSINELKNLRFVNKTSQP